MASASSLQLELTGIEDKGVPFSGEDGTFAGSAEEPFQRWYPYLEGYSPDFVRKILCRYAPNARVVLDPFGGTGTTAFVAGEMGLECYMCEVNPVMQFLFDIKTLVRRYGPGDRQSLVERLQRALRELPGTMREVPPDQQLLAAYESSFRDSTFFEPATLSQVARARSAIDELVASDPVVAHLLTVAILACLVPCSFLKRAGDLRYKTKKELARGLPRFETLLRSGIHAIISDLSALSEAHYLRRRPTLACGDARTLADIPALNADTLVTSPPYINGTNYFRNTRLELWFLRSLRHRDDLARLRRLAVTAGINDVTQARDPGPVHPDVDRVVKKLAQTAYDVRIPMMVASYFADMREIFAGVAHHLTRDAVVAVDIGDSIYGNVHVPADRLLSAVLKDLGYTLEKQVVVRPRHSKNGAMLKQLLLLFRARGGRSERADRKVRQPWTASWTAFRLGLPHQKEPYAHRNWGNELHSLCSYPGKLKPAIAYHLATTFVPAGGRMLDPFAGVGTIPFEAALNGRTAYGFELSPAAFTIAAAKLSLPSASEATDVVAALAAYLTRYVPSDEELQEAARFGLNGRIKDYYNAETLREVLGARKFFASRPSRPAEWLAKAACLHILHGNRPYAVSRRSHPLTPYKPTGPSEYRALIPRLKDKVDRALQTSLPREFHEGRMFYQDATDWWPAEVNELDAVVTSPPFFDSTRFHVQNWLRLWFAGWDPLAFQSKPKLFVDERQKQTFGVYESILRQSRDRLNRDGVVVLHLGKSAKCDMAKELTGLAKRWFRHSEVFDESVAHCESHGLRDKGTVVAHQYLVLY